MSTRQRREQTDETPEPETLTPTADLATAIGQAMAAALAASQGNQAEAMKEIAKVARSRRSESYNGDFEFPNLSAFNPEGDADPRPPLACRMWIGIWNDKTREAQTGYEMEWDQLSKREILLLNRLVEAEGAYPVERTDGVRGTLRVVVDRDPGGAPTRLILTYPHGWLDQDTKNAVPSIVAAARQVLEPAAVA